MQKWEYLKVETDRGRADVPKGYEFQGQEDKRFYPEVVCNRLGDHGWELTGVASTDSTVSYQLVSLH